MFAGHQLNRLLECLSRIFHVLVSHSVTSTSFVFQIAPDFDPSKLRRGFGAKSMKCEVRMMLPYSVQCNTCGEYMYPGKKLTARKMEPNEDYLGIRILRFVMKCCNCNAEFSIRTDLKNSDYTCEWGVTRNFEPWRDQEAAIERERKVGDRKA